MNAPTATLAPPTTGVAPLTPHDRCDRCGVAAVVRATLLTGDILLCGHCGRKHRDALLKLAINIHDETNF